MIPSEAIGATSVDAAIAVRRPALVQIERWVARVVGAFAVAALLADIAILLIGVIARFGFNRPLVWSDELASIVFLWLAMLGSVLALWTGEHMRLTTIVARLPWRWRMWAETLATLAPLLFVALLMSPAFDYVDDQSFVTTPALGWSDALRTAAVPVGFALMLIISALRTLQFPARDVTVVATALGVIAAVVWFVAPVVTGIGNWKLIVFFVLLLGAGG